MNLSDFLLARIAEDEETARTAAPGPWSYGSIESVAGGSLYDPGVMIASIHWDNSGDAPDPRIHRFRSEEQADRTGEHIARHDPARVLAECEAKRRLILACTHEVENWVVVRPGVRQNMPVRVPWGDDDLYEDALKFLALPYADHPDYDEAWRP